MTIEKAIEFLKQEYERAKNLEYVRNPVDYALYETWKEASHRTWKKANRGANE